MCIKVIVVLYREKSLEISFFVVLKVGMVVSGWGISFRLRKRG